MHQESGRSMRLHHLFGAVAAAAVLSTPAHALNTLKRIQVVEGDRVELHFDGKVDLNQVRTEYKQDIIQLSLEETAVYPAKIQSAQGPELTKVFAYQYTPKLTRCRFTVKGEAENYRDRVELKADGKVLLLRISDAAKKAAQADAGERRPTAKASAVPAPREAEGAAVEVEDRALLSRIMNGGETKEAAAGEKAEKFEKVEKVERNDERTKERRSGRDIATARSEAGRPLTGGKPLPSPLRPLASLAGLLALLGGVFWLVRRTGRLENHKGFGRLAKSFAKLGLGSRGRMIEVLQTHHLGPKKSISVVKVGGRTLVLGITSESINLIAQLDGVPSASQANGELDDLGEEIARASDQSPDAGFADLLFGAGSSAGAAGASRPSVAPSAQSAGPAAQAISALRAAAGAAAGAAARGAASLGGPHAGAGATAAEPAMSVHAPIDARPSASVRAQIRSRLEGMKQL
jgi:flagellar biogenesis protein FliO